MATRTTSQAGDWSLNATWGGATPPGNGDTAVVNHAITVTDARTVGTSPSDTTTLAVTCNSGGTITISGSGYLTVRGNFDGTGLTGFISVAAGCTLEFDPSAALTPTTQYLCRLETTFSYTTGGFQLINNGTVKSHATGGKFKIGGAGHNNGLIDANNGGTFDRVGVITTFTTYAGVLGYLGVSGTPSPGFRATNTVFTQCDGIDYTGVYDTSFPPDVIITPLQFTGVTWNNSNALGALHIKGQSQHLLINSTFDILVDIRSYRATITGSYCLGGFDNSTGGSDTKGLNAIANCILRSTSTSQMPRPSDWQSNLMIVDGSVMNWADGTYSVTSDLSNPHWTTPTGAADTYAITKSVQLPIGIFESFGSTGDGDIDYGPNSTGLNSAVSYVVILPDPNTNANGHLNAGTVTTINGWSGANCTYDHITQFGGTQGALACAEAGNGFANMISSAQSNIVWSEAAQTGEGFNKFCYLPTNPAGAVNNMVTPSALGHNCLFNLNPAHTHTNSINYYDLPFTSSAGIGTGDVIADPAFADSTRVFWKWVQSIEPSWSGVPAPTRLQFQARGLWKLNLSRWTASPDYDARYTYSAYNAYIVAGFTPTNPSLTTGGHDGTTIGAIAAGASPPPPPAPSGGLSRSQLLMLGAGGGSSGDGSSPLPPLLVSLLGAYRLDGNLNDSNSSGNNLSGTATYVTGLLGQAATPINATRGPLTGQTGLPASISAWFQLNSDGADCIFGWNGFPFTVEVDVNTVEGSTVFGLIDSASGPFLAENVHPDGAGTWVHVVFTTNGTNRSRLYIDGSLFQELSTIPSVSLPATDIVLQGTSGIPVDMGLLYNRELTPTEVTQLFNGGVGLDPTA